MIRKPLWSVIESEEDGGGSDDGDEEEPPPGEDQGGDGDDEDGDEKESGDDTPLSRALKRQTETNKRLRREMKELRDSVAEKGDVDKAAKEAEAKWKPRVVNSSAKAALLAAGAEKPERLLKLLNHDDLDVTDSGDIDGLDDEVDRLREEYPELFKRKGPSRLETRDRSDKGPKKELTASERQAKSILGA